jgi:hypothetical protein
MTERMQHLFEAARQDGPSQEARVAMWVGIETASLSVGAASGGASAAIAAKTAIASSKLVLGVILGASLTVGIAGAIAVGMVSTQNARPSAQAVAVAPRSLGRVEPVAPTAASDPSVIAGHVSTPIDIELPASKAEKEPVRTATTTLSEHDRLAREARAVNEARGALHRGEPEVALGIVRAARSQHGARLVPEEMTVEAQALRAMGDEAGAQRVLQELATKFPNGELPAH